MSFRTIALCLTTLLLLAACGQRGPLYLPDQSPPVTQNTDVEKESAIPEGQEPDGQAMPEFEDGPIPGPAAVDDDEDP